MFVERTITDRHGMADIPSTRIAFGSQSEIDAVDESLWLIHSWSNAADRPTSRINTAELHTALASVSRQEDMLRDRSEGAPTIHTAAFEPVDTTQLLVRVMKAVSEIGLQTKLDPTNTEDAAVLNNQDLIVAYDRARAAADIIAYSSLEWASRNRLAKRFGSPIAPPPGSSILFTPAVPDEGKTPEPATVTVVASAALLH